ncbi:uncharacterized protein [Parasteatoda tepidariorum]|uniref:uncharacterized protein n=1 Tax=Parasteatoda tepidariorum TaxID=114398 RepID=UPI001C71D735|nr:uncharacterized protein LOC122269324 [Parasteatoda tepidariorum]
MDQLRRKCTKRLAQAVAERLLFMVCLISFGIYLGMRVLSPYIQLIILFTLIISVTCLLMQTKDRINRAVLVDSSDEAASFAGVAYHGLDSGPPPPITDIDIESNYSEDASTFCTNQDVEAGLSSGKSPTSESRVPGKPQKISLNIACPDEMLPRRQDEESDLSSGRCSMDTQKCFASREMSLEFSSDEANSTEWPVAKFYMGEEDESSTGDFDFNTGGIYYGTPYL